MIARGWGGRRVAGALAAVLLASGCALTVREHRALGSWLACSECDAGQFDSVVALARRPHKRGAVIGALRDAALVRADTVRIMADLAQAYARDSARAPAVIGALRPLLPSRETWVQAHARNRVAVVQARALRALAVIDSGGARLRATLDSLRARWLRPDILNLVDSLRALAP